MLDMRDAIGYFSQWGHDISPYAFTGTLEEDAIATIKAKKPENIEIVAFVGMWCPDCVRDWPRLQAICRAAGINLEGGFGVSRDKKEPAGQLAFRKVTRLPTFIVLDGKKELGRYEENPKGTSLEADIAAMLANRA